MRRRETEHDPLASPPRRRRVWTTIGFALAVLAVLYVAGWMITGSRFSSEMARLKAQGEPVTPSDLLPKLKPGEPNAADTYEQAFTFTPRQTIADLYPMWDTQVLTLSQKYALAQTMVASNRQYFELLEEASRIDQCAFQEDWDEFGPHFDQLHGLLTGMRALLLQAELQVHQGDLDGALDSCAEALRLKNHAEQLPWPVGYRVARVTVRGVQEEIVHVLSGGDPSPAACRLFFDQLGRHDYRATWIRDLKTERAAKTVEIDWLEHGGLFQEYRPRRPAQFARAAYPIVAKPLWNADKGRSMELLEAYLEAAKQPWPEAVEAAWRLDKQAKAVPDSPTDAWNESVGPYLFGRFGYAFWRAGREAAMAGALQVALALKAYHHERGTYPATLAEVERAGWKLPPDPFSRRPYHYRRDTRGFTVWSVGPDGKDDSGLAISGDPMQRPKPGYDFAVRCMR